MERAPSRPKPAKCPSWSLSPKPRSLLPTHGSLRPSSPGGVKPPREYYFRNQSTARSSRFSHHDARPCPGIPGDSNNDRKASLRRLLKTAEVDGAPAREAVRHMTTKKGNLHHCNICTTTNERRDRLVAHVLLEHTDIKTWGCPQWYVYFHRVELTAHIVVVQIDTQPGRLLARTWSQNGLHACGMLLGGGQVVMARSTNAEWSSGMSITKSNWYQHAKICKPYLAEHGGERKLAAGKIQSGKKRKAPESDEESGEEELPETKVCAFLLCSCSP